MMGEESQKQTPAVNSRANDNRITTARRRIVKSAPPAIDVSA